ncbi:MAG: hypothetical protein ABI707_01855 [Ferruginibacter sp.]
MKASSFLKSSVIALAFLCLSPLAKAQPGDTGPDPDPNGGGAPLDLGISVFIAAGIGYAAKKKYDARKKEKIADSTEK